MQDDMISSIEFFGFQLKVLDVFFTSDKVEMSSLESIFLYFNLKFFFIFVGNLLEINDSISFNE